ncbi:MAG TPA: hypothetical protein VHY91_27545 [Pirellulales bacterium]|jgi:hypothetical protein|nr:hypothetical protein [Pirellulales bacterium]
MFASPKRLICAGSWLLLAVLASTTARAEDFRIDSRVFAGKEPKPVSENTTLFHVGIVYDYIPNKSIAIFDKPRRKFVLLDRQRHVKAEVTVDQLQTFCDRLQHFAAKDSNPFVRFVSEPHFDATMGEKANELILSSPHMTYRLITTKADSPEASQQYREFSDWYSRLNVMMNPSSTPPFPRLAVNDELAQRGLLAEQVQLTVPQQSALHRHTVELRSEHHIAWRLLQTDLDLINETTTQLTTFKPIGLDEYRRLQNQVQVSKR